MRLSETLPTPFLIPYSHLSTAPGENRGHLATSHLPSPRETWLGKISEVGFTLSLSPAYTPEVVCVFGMRLTRSTPGILETTVF